MVKGHGKNTALDISKSHTFCPMLTFNQHEIHQAKNFETEKYLNQ